VIAHASRLAVVRATDRFHVSLRAALGLRPPGHAGTPVGLAYCGREFRVYPRMRVTDAIRFYAALHERWDGATLRADLDAAGVLERFEVRRMKRAFQRALVLAFASASQPDLLVVENAEDFDEPATATLLDRCTRRAVQAILTYGDDAPPTGGEAYLYDALVDAAAFDPAGFVEKR
jgi:hypothetical protein